MKRSLPYASPLGPMLLVMDDVALAGLYFLGQKHFPPDLPAGAANAQDSLAQKALRQLDAYFQGERTAFDLPLSPQGTAFQRAVWDGLLAIPYGRTITYGELARQLGRPQSVRAVGAAVGRNPLSILIPCHRVIGADGSLTGYAGGLDRKRALLELENKLP